MNKIFTIILSIVLSLPITVWAVDETTAVTEPLPAVNQIDEDANSSLDDYKQPISNRKIAKKFLLAMAGVAVSSFTIFFLLSVYNKIRSGFVNQVKTPEGETSLKTPDDLDEAVKSFIKKTQW